MSETPDPSAAGEALRQQRRQVEHTCACGCGETYVGPKHQRYLNQTHQQRAAARRRRAKLKQTE